MCRRQQSDAINQRVEQKFNKTNKTEEKVAPFKRQPALVSVDQQIVPVAFSLSNYLIFPNDPDEILKWNAERRKKNDKTRKPTATEFRRYRH